MNKSFFILLDITIYFLKIQKIFLLQKILRTPCSLSFERPKESEPKACPEAKPKGKAVGVALSASY